MNKQQSLPVQHAVYSPSSAHRWFECPGSIRLSKDIPRTSSAYADEGTAAHTLLAMCFAGNRPAIAYLGDRIAVQGTDISYPVTETMVDAVQQCLDLVGSLASAGYNAESEVSLSLGHLHPGQFGTGDFVLSKQDHLCVLDFKYGQGVVVEPQDNPQLLSYGSGAWQRALKQKEQPTSLTLVIVQPRAPGISIKKWDVDHERLKQFEQQFKAAAQAASQPDAPLHPGTHCRFCPASAICPALRQQSMAVARAEFGLDPPPPETLSQDDLGQILAHTYLLEHWFEAVHRYALAQAIQGRPPTGFKLVRKNTLRKWLDEDKAAEIIAFLYDIPETELWKRKLISPAQIEKLVSKTDAKGIQALITQPVGDVTLAPNTDRRESVPPDALKEFAQTMSLLANKEIVHD